MQNTFEKSQICQKHRPGTESREIVRMGLGGPKGGKMTLVLVAVKSNISNGEAFVLDAFGLDVFVLDVFVLKRAVSQERVPMMRSFLVSVIHSRVRKGEELGERREEAQ